MIRIAILSVTVALLSSSFLCAADLASVPKDQFHLFILAGQSNMAGRGKPNEEDKTPHPRVFMYTAEGKWVPAVDPVHFDKPKVAGTGLGKSFAIAYAEDHPDVIVGLIPCAVGGTPIAKWQPGAFDEHTKTHPWDDAVVRCRAAIPSGTVQGILWHQGEGDTNFGRSAVYAEKLKELIGRFRTELGAPDAPFVVGELGQFKKNADTPEYKEVILALKGLPDAVPNCGFASSEGMSHIGDNTHFDAESLREFGRRYYAVYREIELRNK